MISPENVIGIPSENKKNNVHYKIIYERIISKHAKITTEFCVNIMERPYGIIDKDIKDNMILSMRPGYFSDDGAARKLLESIGEYQNGFNFSFETIQSGQLLKDYQQNWTKFVVFLLENLDLEWIMPKRISLQIARYSLSNYNIKLLRIRRWSIYCTSSTEYLGLNMYYDGKVPLDFQTFIPMDAKWMDSIEKSHTFDVQRRTTWDYIRNKTKWYNNYFEQKLKEKEEERKAMEVEMENN